MTTELPPSSREPGRRGKQGETRARLIDVAIEIVRQEGLPALTTSRIARAAGIAQPGFYAHFKNIDELLRTAVSQVGDEMQRRAAAARRCAIERFAHVTETEQLAIMRGAYEDTLKAFLSDPRFAELFLRYRRDPSLLGDYMRHAMRRVRQDVRLDLELAARYHGFTHVSQDEITLWADQILALYFATAEALLDSRHDDPDRLLDTLARSSIAIRDAFIQARPPG